MKAYDVRRAHRIAIHAVPQDVWSALHEISLREVPTFRALMTLRELPGIAVGRRWLTADLDRPILDQMAAAGFVPIGCRPPSEIVLGLVARPWRPAGAGPRIDDARSFADFDAPGWMKAILSFRLETDGHVTRLESETRARGTDAAARWKFRVYWAAIGWASSLTRTAWLDSVRRRCERA